MWRFRKIKQKKRASSVTKHYQEHKEKTRALVQTRIAHYNQHYQFFYKRIAIRNQRRCWGSCSSLKNLNFNYKLYFLPDHLCDYIIVHELCHLQELNHGPRFWQLVAQTMPNYKAHVIELRQIDRRGHNVAFLEALKSIQPLCSGDRIGDQ